MTPIEMRSLRRLTAGILAPVGDEKLRARLATQARQRFLEEFTADKMVARTAGWLMECARKYGRRARKSESP